MIRYKILHDQKIILSQWVGEASVEDVNQFLRTIRADPEYDPYYHTLNDIRQLRSLFEEKQSSIILQEINQLKREFRIKSASVVSSDVQFGIGRMYDVFHERINIDYRVFRDMESACEWLGADWEAIERALQEWVWEGRAHFLYFDSAVAE